MWFLDRNVEFGLLMWIDRWGRCCSVEYICVKRRTLVARAPSWIDSLEFFNGSGSTIRTS